MRREPHENEIWRRLLQYKMRLHWNRPKWLTADWEGPGQVPDKVPLCREGLYRYVSAPGPCPCHYRNGVLCQWHSRLWDRLVNEARGIYLPAMWYALTVQEWAKITVLVLGVVFCALGLWGLP